MGIYLADQTFDFLWSILTGAALALLFDFFRISRIAIPTNSAVVFVEDVLFFIVCAVTTFALMLTQIDGQVRFFLIVGEVLGAILYFLTLGRLVMAVSRTIIAIIKGILLFVFRRILVPVWRLIYFIVGFLLRPVYFLIGIIKKNMQRCKFRLKVNRLVVYNHLMERMRERIGKTGENVHEAKEKKR